ncbi:interferon alpha-F-like [Pristis pectinata]|uniref:interferon alpha-F-like n=1 Tax=Pristis pectinata TaxID=685728 RepID=UPI00223DE9F0|nr:interferon alpha-F-like [Pristis pectinata]
MVLPNAWRPCILLVLLPGILAQGCRNLQEDINQDAQRELNEMGGPLSKQCSLEKRSLGVVTVKLYRLVKMGQERISVVNQTLHHISEIYSMNLSSVTWPRDKVENLRVLLDGQLRELETCVRKRGSGSQPRTSSAIEKYFTELSKFLERKGFSACAWEITRAETQAYFRQFPHIMAAISE